MRSGKLDRTITLQAFANTVDDYGTPVSTWTDFATRRAELVQASTDEFLAGYGETSTMAVVFRIRWLDGVTPEHRVLYEGRVLNIRELTEIGRRRSVELRCEEVRS